MSQPLHQNPEDILQLIKAGDFGKLIGITEDLQFDAKAAPYFQRDKHSSEKARYELAKDVSALANASGGLIVIGCSTKKHSDSRAEQIETLHPFEQSLVDVEQYSMILNSWLTPNIPRLEIKWHPSAHDTSKGLVTIFVPASAADHAPYLISKLPPGEDGKQGALFAYHIRSFSYTTNASVEFLQSKLQLGMQLPAITERLSAIETKLDQLIDAEADHSRPGANPVTLSTGEIESRIEEAKKRSQLLDRPAFILLAYAVPIVNFPTLAAAQTDPLPHAFDHPTVLRPDGFSIGGGPPSTHSSQVRRTYANGDFIVELWRDGLFLAIARGDHGFLAWGKARRPGVGIPINNYVLAEATVNFIRQAAQLFKYSDPEPDTLRFRLTLSKMVQHGHPPTLQLERENVYTPPFFDPHSADQPAFNSEAKSPFASLDAGAVAYDLLARIYEDFGYVSEEMPYLDAARKRIQF